MLCALSSEATIQDMNLFFILIETLMTSDVKAEMYVVNGNG